MNKYSKKEPKKNGFNLVTIDHAEVLVLRKILIKALKVKGDYNHVIRYPAKSINK